MADQERLEKWSVTLEQRIADELAADPIPFEGSGDRPVWSIDTPPPYPSGRWHIGAVAGYSLIDMIARSRRLLGYDVLFPWGTDRNGINIEFAIEKETKRRMQDWDRADFVAACEEAISGFSDDMVRIGERIGLSCDFRNGYTTDSPDYRGFSQEQFLKLFEQGLVVESLRPNTYDPKLGTSIADAEVFYEERKTRLHHVRWTVKDPDGGPDGTVVVSTTRPELIPACQVVLVHPDNEDTKHLVGKTAVLPLFGREVPVRAHPHVKTDFGSGVMMVCSYGDQADVQLFRELDLQPIAAIGMDGRMTEAAGPYEGLKVQEAKEGITRDLEGKGLLDGHDEVDQKFPISERSKAPVEIILLKEWYVRQTHAVDDLRAITKDMDFVPPKHRQLLLDWIDSVTIDWPISRRRWYHTEIPIWYVLDADEEETDYVIVPPAGIDEEGETPYYRPWCEDPPVNSTVLHRETREKQGGFRRFMEGHEGWSWKGEEKVFDTWMDSSVSNLYILKEHVDKEWHKDHTCSIRPQGRDIVRTWLYYTLLKTWLLEQRPAFDTAWIHGMGMDKHGRKMSKSLGNVIDPDQILGKYGSDAFRLWIAGECTIGDDFRIDEQKIQGTGKFLQKLANVVNFVRRFEAPQERPTELHPCDAWILGELDRVTATTRAGYEGIDFFRPANAVRSFVWNLFAPHYVEMVKGRAYDGDPAACWTLQEVVRRVLLLLAPVAPFVTHYLADRVYGLDVHRAALPEPLGFDADEAVTEAVVAFNSEVWKRKKDQGLSLAAPIDGIEVPELLSDFGDVLSDMHKLDAASQSEVVS